MIEVCGEGDGLLAPIPQAEKHADADAAEAGGVSAIRAGQSPVVILFRSGRVQARVGRAVVGLLVNDQSFRACADQREVIGSFHRRDFDGERRDFRREGAEDLFEVTVGNELRMLPGHEEDIAEALRGEMAGFGADFFGFECDAQDGVLAGKTAVGAAVDALVGQIKRSEKAHGSAEMPAGQRARAPGHVLELIVIHRRQVAGKGGHGRTERQAERGENFCRIGRRDVRRVHARTIVYRDFLFCNCKTGLRSGNLTASCITAKQK